jgi:hypothetical protein
MPSVVCPFCRRSCRVREKSLGRAVVCTHCAKSFTADTPEPDQPGPERYLYEADSPQWWYVVGGLVVLLTVVALVVWNLARRS